MPSVTHALRSLIDPMTLCGIVGGERGTLHDTRVTCGTCLRVMRQPLQVPESALLRALREAAQGAGYLCYHTHRSDHSEAGWPDVALCKPHHPLYLLELKTATGKLTVEQDRWITTLAQCTSVHAAVVRPADLEDLVAMLRAH
jgi:hypothetical protein